MFRITLSLAGNVVRKYPFEKDKVTVGRDAECDISIDNVAVSRTHATITLAEGEWVLEDLQSGNGTFVNGEKIVTHVLQSGEAFIIGKYSLLFEVVSDAGAIVQEARQKAGGEDATFRLDRKELEKLIGKAGKGGDQKAALLPDGGGAPVPLLKPYHFVGSTPDATIPASGAFVSPRVAIFLKDEGGMRLVRVGGKFGKVLVNGQEVDTRVLRSGDVLDFCGKKYKYILE
jgi:pSer/pThr/pTyr-binding forkhead associated (FHA) protein